jgi:hypothetical protein
VPQFSGETRPCRSAPGPGTAKDVVVSNFAGRRRLQSREDLQQRGLARSTAAGNSDQFGWFDRQRQLLKNPPRTDLPAHLDRIDPRGARRPGTLDGRYRWSR